MKEIESINLIAILTETNLSKNALLEIAVKGRRQRKNWWVSRLETLEPNGGANRRSADLSKPGQAVRRRIQREWLRWQHLIPNPSCCLKEVRINLIEKYLTTLRTGAFCELFHCNLFQYIALNWTKNFECKLAANTKNKNCKISNVTTTKILFNII